MNRARVCVIQHSKYKHVKCGHGDNPQVRKSVILEKEGPHTLTGQRAANFSYWTTNESNAC